MMNSWLHITEVESDPSMYHGKQGDNLLASASAKRLWALITANKSGFISDAWATCRAWAENFSWEAASRQFIANLEAPGFDEEFWLRSAKMID